MSDVPTTYGDLGHVRPLGVPPKPAVGEPPTGGL